MDDIYQYTASAVNSNNDSRKHDKSNDSYEDDTQNDPLIKAFTNLGWGQRFNSLMNTVKKQSEVIVDVTKKDLQEFANILREDSNELVEQLSQSTSSTATIINNDSNSTRTVVETGPSTETEKNDTAEGLETTANENNSSLYASSIMSLRDGLGKINTVNFTALREGLSDTLLNQAILPAQIKSIKLPDNINLGELRQELDEGTRFAELYLQKFGTEVLQVLNRTITVLEPEEQMGSDSQRPEAHSETQVSDTRIFANRTEALIAKLQTDRDTLLTDPEDVLTANKDQTQINILRTFNAGFNVEEYTSEISRLLDGSPALRQTMDDLVPIRVDYTTFWRRYFYHAWKIDQEEQRRKLIVKGAEQDHDEDDFRWDSDEEENTPCNKSPVNHHADKTVAQSPSLKKGKETVSRTDELANDTNKSDTDFSNISEPASTEASFVSPPLKSQVDDNDWVKTSTEEERQKQLNINEDSDSDWE